MIIENVSFDYTIQKIYSISWSISMKPYGCFCASRGTVGKRFGIDLKITSFQHWRFDNSISESWEQRLENVVAIGGDRLRPSRMASPIWLISIFWENLGLTRQWYFSF